MKARTAGVLGLKIAVTAAALAWAFSRLSLAELGDAFGRVTAGTLVVATALLFVNVFVGTARWRVLIRAYGTPPGFLVAAHAYLVAGFYNMFLPANVGGDVLRAHAMRGAFPHALDSYFTVLVERVLGLVALVVLSGVGLLSSQEIPRWVGASVLASGGLVFVVLLLLPVIVREVLPRLPPSISGRLPRVSTPPWQPQVLGALGLSLVSQGIGLVVVHLLLAAVHPALDPWTSLQAVPLALLSLYVPVSIAGLGVREAAFVVVLGRVGVSAGSATAASLLLMGTMGVVAATGALAHLVRPLGTPENPPGP